MAYGSIDLGRLVKAGAKFGNGKAEGIARLAQLSDDQAESALKLVAKYESAANWVLGIALLYSMGVGLSIKFSGGKILGTSYGWCLVGSWPIALFFLFASSIYANNLQALRAPLARKNTLREILEHLCPKRKSDPEGKDLYYKRPVWESVAKLINRMTEQGEPLNPDDAQRIMNEVAMCWKLFEQYPSVADGGIATVNNILKTPFHDNPQLYFAPLRKKAEATAKPNPVQIRLKQMIE